MDEQMLLRQVAQKAQLLVAEARRLGQTMGCAESCTGGLVSAAITSVPGSSEVLLGGVVSYAPAVKHAVLGVAQEILDAPGLGPVSEPCALQMSEGARRLLSCDVAVSVTGIAGPGGEEPGKPVGTVWFGISSNRGSRSSLCQFDGTRDQVRLQAVAHALSLLYEEIVER